MVRPIVRKADQKKCDLVVFEEYVKITLIVECMGQVPKKLQLSNVLAKY